MCHDVRNEHFFIDAVRHACGERPRGPLFLVTAGICVILCCTVREWFLRPDVDGWKLDNFTTTTMMF